MKTSVATLLILFQANHAFALDSPLDAVHKAPSPVIRELPLQETATLRASQTGEAFVTLTHQDNGYLLQRWLPTKQAEATHQKSIPLNEQDTDWWVEAVSMDANRILIDTSSDTGTPYLLYDFLSDTLTRVEHGASFAGALASFSLDGRYLALASTVGDTLYIQVLDATNGKPVTEQLKHGEDYFDDSKIPGLALLQFSPDSKSIISQGRYLARQWTIEDNVNVLTYATGWDTGERNVFVESMLHPTVGRLFSQRVHDDNLKGPEKKSPDQTPDQTPDLPPLPAEQPTPEHPVIAPPAKPSAKNCLLLDFQTQLPRLFSCQGHALLQPEQSLILFQTGSAAPDAIDSNTGQIVPLPTWLQSLAAQGNTQMDMLSFSPNGEWLGYRRCTSRETPRACTWQVSRWQSGKTFELLTLPSDNQQDKLIFLSTRHDASNDALPYSMLLLQGKRLPERAYVWE